MINILKIGIPILVVALFACFIAILLMRRFRKITHKDTEGACNGIEEALKIARRYCEDGACEITLYKNIKKRTECNVAIFFCEKSDAERAARARSEWSYTQTDGSMEYMLSKNVGAFCGDWSAFNRAVWKRIKSRHINSDIIVGKNYGSIRIY